MTTAEQLKHDEAVVKIKDLVDPDKMIRMNNRIIAFSNWCLKYKYLKSGIGSKVVVFIAKRWFFYNVKRCF